MAEIFDKVGDKLYPIVAQLYNSIIDYPQLASRDLHREVIVSSRWLGVNKVIESVRVARTQFDNDGFEYEYDYYANLVGYKLELLDNRVKSLKQGSDYESVNKALNARRRAIHNDLIGNLHEMHRASRASGAEGNFENFLALMAREVTRCTSPDNVDESLYADQIKFGSGYREPNRSYYGDGVNSRMRNRMSKLYDALLVFRDRHEYRQFVNHVVEEVALPLFDYHSDFWGAALHLERQVFGLEGYGLHKPLITAAGNAIVQGRFYTELPNQETIDAQVKSGDKGAPFDEYDEG